MATFRREPTYLRSYRDRVIAAQERCQLALDSGTVQPHENDGRTWHGGGDGRYRVPTIGLNSGHMPGTRPGAVR